MLPGREPLGRYRSYVRSMRYKASTSLCMVTPLDRRCIYGASVGRFCFLLSSDTVISLDVAPFVDCLASHWSRYTAMSMPISHPSPKDVEVEVVEDVEALEYFYSYHYSYCFCFFLYTYTLLACSQSFLSWPSLSRYTEASSKPGGCPPHGFPFDLDTPPDPRSLPHPPFRIVPSIYSSDTPLFNASN